MAIVIAGERSGVGKTTVTLALLSSLSKHKRSVQSFKVGPDYIDPMFHTAVTGRPCRNLDPVLTSEAYVRDCFARHIQGVDYALIEGVMGLFDGASGRDDRASTAHVARLLQLPVLLVLDCSRLSRSVAAIAHGYRSFDPRIQLAGLVLNRVGSDRHLELLKDALEPLNIPILGVLRRQDTLKIPDRHLGLVPTAEFTQLDTVIEQLTHIGDSCFDWECLERELKVSRLNVESSVSSLQPSTFKPSAQSNLPLRGTLREQPSKFQRSTFQRSTFNFQTFKPSTPIRIAVARDRAFSFYYPDNLDILQQLGAELVFWSPLTDSELPTDVRGLYFGGGFPEVFAQHLAENTSAREAVRKAILTGMPTYAECGGLMYMCEQITDLEGQSWPMLGVLPTTTVMAKRLTVGYRQATALRDSPLLNAGVTVWGHEFHHSQLTAMPGKPLFEIRGMSERGQDKVAIEGWQVHQLHASYIHLHWGENPEIPAQFLRSCDASNN